MILHAPLPDDHRFFVSPAGSHRLCFDYIESPDFDIFFTFSGHISIAVLLKSSPTRMTIAVENGINSRGLGAAEL